MSIDINELEKAWLAAETMADEAKRRARQVDAEVTQVKTKAREGTEIKVLISSLEEAKARQEQAERSASDAFDRLWQAKSSKSGGAAAFA